MEPNPNLSTDGAAGEQTPTDIVRAFLSAMERLDFDDTLALAAPDIRWVNAPITSAKGKASFGRACRGMFKGVTRFEVEYLDIHERGHGVVFTDRIDTIEGRGLNMRIAVQGEFQVRDGLIVDWVDRFSWRQAIGDIVKSLPAILAHPFRR
ncbi:MAG: limonene-1,2-epoxide hydrolase family protein [Myxococcota bacterium]